MEKWVEYLSETNSTRAWFRGQAFLVSYLSFFLSFFFLPSFLPSSLSFFSWLAGRKTPSYYYYSLFLFSSINFAFVQCWFKSSQNILIIPHRAIHRCFTSTETIQTNRDGEPRTSTSTFTQLLNSNFCLIRQIVLIHTRPLARDIKTNNPKKTKQQQQQQQQQQQTNKRITLNTISRQLLERRDTYI